ncbi:hypothetical protein SAMN04487895_112133 [Paenibacillus sophorae]|uniref:Uncharacterized protein n=1 Tax=Paenibacillus sophorae TaxID=1333845 RepID=A0A1H8SXC2_9BACL|nr:hypothetical protein [Paenibacillus sophorae]QWU15584.1 hypothetical protein KP014_27710 [Paenibacillus sophorae]SEO82833.1 hypothetical protein SAMN04487895_112133 [Paenibacillus sophorae]
MAYIRLIVLVLAFEVFITALVGLGIYVGFSVFPFSQMTITAPSAAAQTIGFHATIPLYMPMLSDLKVPYTQLQAGKPVWGIAAILVSAAAMVAQSFVRGMYLGGIKGWVQSQAKVPLIKCGRRYFKDMLAWSVFQNVLSALAFFLAAVFFPFGIILIVALLFLSLTPYLIVLKDLSPSEAFAEAPGLFRRYFWTLLPLALLAMLCTLIVSLLRSLPQPMGYAVPLLAYAVIGTLLIAELMRRLEGKLQEDGGKTPHLPFGEALTGRISTYITVLLVPVLVMAGVLSASGRHLSAFDFGGKERLAGVSYIPNFSEVFSVSEKSYTAYEWLTGDFRIAMRLPDLSGGRTPRELRGIADITWLVNEETHYAVNGIRTSSSVQPFTRKSRLMYRLVRETAQDGSFYYSSMNGSASILPGGERPRDPLSVQITVSGNGSNIFVLQYPTRFGLTQVFRVSDDGQYLIPSTSQVNPMDFHVYWFTAEQRKKDVFELLAAKNKNSFLATLNRAYLPLAAAMQEGDGRMVVKILETMRTAGVQVKAPDWDERAWTDYLRSQYEGASLQKTLEFVTKAVVLGSYASRELPEKSGEKATTYRFEVPFPTGTVPIAYEESKENGRLVSVTLFK